MTFTAEINVMPLKELLDLRTRLNDLKGTLQTNEKLDEALLDAVSKVASVETKPES